MELVVKSEKIKNIASRWAEHYLTEKWHQKFSPFYLSKHHYETYLRLRELPADATEQDIADIIGHDAWTVNICFECNKESEVVIMLGESPADYNSKTVWLCYDCLLAAIKMMEDTIPSSKEQIETLLRGVGADDLSDWLDAEFKKKIEERRENCTCPICGDPEWHSPDCEIGRLEDRIAALIGNDDRDELAATLMEIIDRAETYIRTPLTSLSVAGETKRWRGVRDLARNILQSADTVAGEGGEDD